MLTLQELGDLPVRKVRDERMYYVRWRGLQDERTRSEQIEDVVRGPARIEREMERLAGGGERCRVMSI